MLHIQPAKIDDTALLRTMIRELADYEHELDRVTITEEDLARDGFGKNPRFRALIAEWDEQPAGYALFFGYYSTWAGRGLFFGRFICATGVPKPRHWQSATGSGGSDRSRGTLLRDTLGSARLERESD
jgi:hypothetical protein